MDSKENIYIGKSIGLQITKSMFEYIEKGKSLNKVIEEIENTEDNKKSNGISGFLTNGYYKRELLDSTAVIAGMQSMLNVENYKSLEKKLVNKI